MVQNCDEHFSLAKLELLVGFDYFFELKQTQSGKLLLNKNLECEIY